MSEEVRGAKAIKQDCIRKRIEKGRSGFALKGALDPLWPRDHVKSMLHAYLQAPFLPSYSPLARRGIRAYVDPLGCMQRTRPGLYDGLRLAREHAVYTRLRCWMIGSSLSSLLEPSLCVAIVGTLRAGMRSDGQVQGQVWGKTKQRCGLGKGNRDLPAPTRSCPEAHTPLYRGALRGLA